MTTEQPAIPAPAVAVGVHAADWRDAVRAAGRLLVDVGAVEPSYGERMVEMVERHGPYIVIAEGVALAHARPGPDVLETAWGIVTLAEPVLFGHPHHDPVSVVIGVAATEPDTHVSAVARIANLFNDPTLIVRLSGAADEVAVLAALR
jgi:ascorbate PTS system EIIA or EIIAB component